MNIDYLKELLLISTVLSTITCTLIQKTKRFIKHKNLLLVYSLFINIIVGILFSKTFTNIAFPQNLWIGLFSFLEADTIYKSLEGKISSYSDLVSKKIEIKKENIINKEEE